MRIASIASGASTVVSCLAACNARRNSVDYACLRQEDAQQVADNFQNLSSEYSDAIADASLQANVTYYGDSMITLINAGCTVPIPLGSSLFSSRSQLKASQSSQPLIPFEIRRMWYNCKAVFVNWEMTLHPEPVRGLAVLETVRAHEGAPFPWVISKVFNEYNSGAWLVDLGIFTPECMGNATASKG